MTRSTSRSIRDSRRGPRLSAAKPQSEYKKPLDFPCAWCGTMLDWDTPVVEVLLTTKSKPRRWSRRSSALVRIGTRLVGGLIPSRKSEMAPVADLFVATCSTTCAEHLRAAVAKGPTDPPLTALPVEAGAALAAKHDPLTAPDDFDPTICAGCRTPLDLNAVAAVCVTFAPNASADGIAATFTFRDQSTSVPVAPALALAAGITVADGASIDATLRCCGDACAADVLTRLRETFRQLQ